MLEILLILMIGLAPSLMSIWIMGRLEARMSPLQISLSLARREPSRGLEMPLDSHYVEGVGYLVGDITCRFNARSSYIRCAVNPQGPCQGCRSYDVGFSSDLLP